MGEDVGLVGKDAEGFKRDKGEFMRALVTGASGMFGSCVKEVFKNDDMIYTDKQELDVSNYDKVMNIIPKLDGVEYILHLAAQTDLEHCDNNPAECYYTNTIGTMNMVQLASLLKIPIIYLSTAGVFLGNKSYYDEFDKAEPANHYGRSKWFGELAVMSYPKHYIFRMSWAFGGGPDLDKKFVNKIISLIKKGTSKIHAISDTYGSPTYEYDVAKTIRACLINETSYGIYHSAGIGRASRYDVACEIVKILKVKVKVTPVTNSYFNLEFPCHRATSEVLINTKVYPSCMRPWQESLKEYLEKDYANTLSS